MEKRASLKPQMPPNNPTTSYWQDPPSRLANYHGSPNLPGSVDMTIIGSGITGATLAYRLLERHPGLSILMLEARGACSGATGRNGGHTKPAAHREFVNNCATLGEVEAAKIVRMQYDCVREIHAFAKEHAIRCHSWEGDTVDIFHSKHQLKKTQEAVRKMKQALGNNDPAVQYTSYDADETERRFLTPNSFGSITYHAGSLSAYDFVIGILELAIDKGLQLHTETPVMGISAAKDADSWTVECSAGRVISKKVVLATNGYTAQLLQELQGFLVPLRGTMTAQRPGKGLASGLQNSYSFIGEDGYEYMIPQREHATYPGDIMIGGGLTKAPEAGLFEYGTTDDSKIDPSILQYLLSSTSTYFGARWGDDDPEGRLRMAWTGIMGYTADAFPLIGEVPQKKDLYIAASFQGSGMVLAFKCAQALVAMMDNQDDEALRNWFPDAFRMRMERLQHKFRGRLHTTAPMDLELRSQI